MKFIVGIIWVCFTTFCGYLMAKKYRQRKDFFIQLNEFNERFINEITYYKRPLLEFINNYVYKGEFDLILQYYLSLLKINNVDKLNINSICSFMTLDEKELVKNYFSMLGQGDSTSQRTYFSSLRSTLDNEKRKNMEDCIRYSDLYIKFGLLFGLLVLILIV